jgi:hypothetical protein
MTRRRGAGKGSGSKGCRGAKHGQACTKERTSAVALRTALESAVQLGRGDKGKPKWTTLRNVGIRYSLPTAAHACTFPTAILYQNVPITWPGLQNPALCAITALAHRA